MDLQDEYINNNTWVTMNNDFCHEWNYSAMIFTSDEVTSENHYRIASRVLHEWKSLPNRFTSHKNRYSRYRMYYFISYTLFYAMNTQVHLELSSSAQFAMLPRAVFSDLALWRHHNWSVTSCEREILVLWRHTRRLLLHVQIGAKAIFTSE